MVDWVYRDRLTAARTGLSRACKQLLAALDPIGPFPAETLGCYFPFLSTNFRRQRVGGIVFQTKIERVHFQLEGHFVHDGFHAETGLRVPRGPESPRRSRIQGDTGLANPGIGYVVNIRSGKARPASAARRAGAAGVSSTTEGVHIKGDDFARGPVAVQRPRNGGLDICLGKSTPRGIEASTTGLPG